jgi:hypothetical protein
VNKYLPHVLVLPEDDADRQLANGFLKEESVATARIQVLREAGGWRDVLSRFESDHVGEMDSYPDRFMILLIDFDDKGEERLNEAKAVIPDRLAARVFVLGAQKEPQDLTRAGLGSFETIGRELAKDCRDDTYSTWGHPQLRHNAAELDRLRRAVRRIIFQPI